MKKSIIYVLVLAINISCSSSKMVQQYKNPDIPYFKSNKVLVIGLSSDAELRTKFEKKVVNAFEKEKVKAVKSIDFFESSFTNNKQSIKELNDIENQLLNAGFDAILFTRVIGKQTKVSIVQSYRNLANEHQNFEAYYFDNQYLNFEDEKESYVVYTTETSLYCICPGKERELLWRGEIEIVDRDNMNRNINKYLNVLLKGLIENQLLVTLQ